MRLAALIALFIAGFALVVFNKTFARFSYTFGARNSTESRVDDHNLLYSRIASVVVGLAMVGIGLTALFE